jgi:hypothetical protein
VKGEYFSFWERENLNSTLGFNEGIKNQKEVTQTNLREAVTSVHCTVYYI